MTMHESKLAFDSPSTKILQLAWTQDPQNSLFFLSVGTEACLEGQKRGGSENKKKKGIPPPP